MPPKASKYPAQYVIFYCFADYMDDDTKNQFKLFIVDRKGLLMPEKQFVKAVTKFVDIERLRLKPMRWQDIWVYNYIKYYLGKDRKLLKQYEQQIIIPSEESFKKLMQEIHLQS